MAFTLWLDKVIGLVKTYRSTCCNIDDRVVPCSNPLSSHASPPLIALQSFAQSILVNRSIWRVGQSHCMRSIDAKWRAITNNQIQFDCRFPITDQSQVMTARLSFVPQQWAGKKIFCLALQTRWLWEIVGGWGVPKGISLAIKLCLRLTFTSLLLPISSRILCGQCLLNSPSLRQ